MFINKITLSSFIAVFISTLIISFCPFAANADTKISPAVTQQIFSKAQQNNNWKLAFATAQHAQIVFMNVSPLTNPKNEIGMEKHKFDQIIIIASGEGKAILDGKTSLIKSGDMIFIPEGTLHNIVNLHQNKDLKIISIYSNTDIPAGSIYKTKIDEPTD